jgi:hypothetical protein
VVAPIRWNRPAQSIGAEHQIGQIDCFPELRRYFPAQLVLPHVQTVQACVLP